MRVLISALATLTLVSMVGCSAAHSADPEPRVAESVTITEAPTLKAYTFDQAEAQCEENFTGQEWEDCIDAALTGWCMFEPFPADSPFHTEEDARCLAEQAMKP